MSDAKELGPAELALETLERLHAAVDTMVAALEERHRGRLQCGRGCAMCCVDELTVFGVEAERIRRGAPEVLRQAPARPGRCAFLARDLSCRVYAHRPYVCRTQGLPLRWVEVEEGPEGRELVESRDICELNVEGEPLEALAPEDCWTLGAVEGKLAALEALRTEGAPQRVALRDLFEAPPA